MKILSWLSAIIGYGLSFWWAKTVYDYFFESTTADYVGLGLSMLAGLALFWKTGKQLNRSWKFGVLVMLLLIPFVLFPAISSLVSQTTVGWLFVYLFLFVIAWGMAVLFDSKLQIPALAVFAGIFFVPYDFSTSQSQYYDPLEASVQTREGSAQIVRWKKDFWLYYNKQLQFSTLDRHLYQEAYVQPGMYLAKPNPQVLLIGGDNGAVEDELSKFGKDISLVICPLDEEFYNFIRSGQHVSVNEVKQKEVLNTANVFETLAESERLFDLIVVDVPDPINVAYQQYYTVEFYQLCAARLQSTGLLITQSWDLYKNGIQSQRIWNSVEEAGLNVLPLQAQIPTIGQWSWVIGSKSMSKTEMRAKLSSFDPKQTKWLNKDAMKLMMNFGKNYFSEITEDKNWLVQEKEKEK